MDNWDNLGHSFIGDMVKRENFKSRRISSWDRDGKTGISLWYPTGRGRR